MASEVKVIDSLLELTDNAFQIRNVLSQDAEARLELMVEGVKANAGTGPSCPLITFTRKP